MNRFKRQMGINEGDSWHVIQAVKNTGKHLSDDKTWTALGVASPYLQQVYSYGQKYLSHAIAWLGFARFAPAVIPAAGLLAAVFGIGAYYLYQRKIAFDEKEGIDSVALDFIRAAMPIGLRIANINRMVTESEKQASIRFFTEKLGYNRDFV